jgi:hypothetical protein
MVRKNRRFKALIWLFLLLLTVSACKAESPLVTALKVVPFCTEISVGVGEYSSRGYLSVESDGMVTSADFTMVSENEEIALLVYDGMVDGFVAFMVKGVSVGETRVYFRSADGSVQSNSIYVTVTPKATETLPSMDDYLKDHENSRITSNNEQSITSVVSQVVSVVEKEETEPVVSDDSREDAKTESSIPPVSSKEEPKSDVSKSSEASEEIGKTHVVYVTPSGKRYHEKQSCGGKNAKATSLEDALENGKTPCGKCVK